MVEDGPVVVTGGNGFIGSHVVDALLARGVEVLILDRHRAPVRHPGVGQFTADVKDREAVFEAVARSSGVVHLAGLLGTAETIGHARNSVEVNLLGSLNVFDAVADAEVPTVNIAVGNVGWLSSYPITKYAAEQFALMYNRERGARIAVVRGLNVYGPRQKDRPVRKVVPTFVRAAMEGRPIQVFGDGLQIVDVIYARDCAEILVDALLLEHGCYDRVMEAGTGRRTTALELAEATWRAVRDGDEPRVEHLPMRPGEPARSVTLGDPATLAPLGWKPDDFTPLDEGLRRTAAWYREAWAETAAP